MNLLLISYHFNPYPGVGAIRPTYWADNGARLGMQVSVITATPQEGIERNYPILFLQDDEEHRLSFLLKDPGLRWKKKLKKHFLTITPENWNYEVVLISGGPFMHFSIGKFLKNRFGCKVVLDYRDPFATNPHFTHESGLKRWLKKRFEIGFNRQADGVLTVNSHCKALIALPEKIAIIPNGFNEQKIRPEIIDQVEQRPGTLLYGGKFYADFSLNPFVGFLQNSSDIFIHVGNPGKALDGITLQNIERKGQQNYEDYLAEIAACEMAVLFTGGAPFESPTKVYDYLAMNKKILVITGREVHTGEIENILNGNPNIEWSVNKTDEIKMAVERLRNRKLESVDIDKYSREHALKTLINYLETL